MLSRLRSLGIIVALLLLSAASVLIAHTRPGYFNNEKYLAGLIFLQLLLAAVWKYRTMFFAFLMLAFVWAGLDVPMAQGWISTRWIVLGTGAVVGYMLFMHDHARSFHAVHLVGLFCVAAAFVSVLVSDHPQTAVLKAASLLLLFLYGSAGGRLALDERGARFFKGLLLACEIITGLTSIAYFVLHEEPWDNPNSLGLVMGVCVAPLLFWGILVAETRPLRWRRSAFFYLSLTLLFYSVSRASILAGITSIVILCVVVRRAKLLLNGGLLALFVLALVSIVAPGNLASLADTSADNLVYKGHRESGVLGSRKSPWQQTFDVISEHPWFGSGFGTSTTGQQLNGDGMYSSNSDHTREHGSSYLAILEWVGLLGVVPFAVLLLLVLWKSGQVLAWMSRTRRVDHPAVPIVLVLLGGLIHAGFEDWLFAVGYYFTVFFWTLVFVLFDLAPGPAAEKMAAPELLPVRNYGRFPGFASQG